MGGMDLQDILYGVDYLVEQGLVDGHRVIFMAIVHELPLFVTSMLLPEIYKKKGRRVAHLCERGFLCKANVWFRVHIGHCRCDIPARLYGM
jgi:hypothetical protein